MNDDLALLDIADGIATLTLNRADKMNAMSIALLMRIRDHLKTVIGASDVRCMVLRAEGKGFCAGLDLAAPRPTDLNPGDPDEIMREYFMPVYTMLHELRVPTIAAVNGAAIGAGLSLAISCDIVIAGRSAFFKAGFPDIGLVPDTGASWLLNSRIGRERAMGMLLLGDRIPAEKAEQWGLVWQCVEDAGLDAAVDAAARKLSVGATMALHHIKLLMREVGSNTYRDQAVLEMDAQSIVRRSEDVAEARKALAERRRPEFKGR